jgi:LPS O-antigen subunit length determinant protein (WzzB/FepE family)
MLETLLTIEGEGKKVSYRYYYTNIYSPSVLGYIKKYTLGLPGLLIKLVTSENDNINIDLVNSEYKVIRITKEEHQLMELLKEQLSISVNDKDGDITVSASMPEPRAAAELVKRAQELLESYVIDFKIEKSSAQLSFIKKRFQEKEIEFKRAQASLAFYSDQNFGMNTARSKTKLLLLQSEYDLAYNIYSELAKQLETQEIKVKEDTPIFTIIDPVFIPLERDKPNRSLILVIFVFLGVISSLALLLGRNVVKTIYVQK